MAPSRALTRPVVTLTRIQHGAAHGRTRRQCLATVAPEQGNGKGTGPLAGIRVLDMTRVLAGVRLSHTHLICLGIVDLFMRGSRIALRCWEI